VRRLVRRLAPGLVLAGLVAVLTGCTGAAVTPLAAAPDAPAVPREARWGIYALDLASGNVTLIYATDSALANLDLSPDGGTFAFSQQYGEAGSDGDEIVTLPVAGGAVSRLTDNAFLDTYPVWSPDGRRILFLTMRGGTLDIHLMDRDGAGERLFYDSGGHDGDIDWVGAAIVFTAQSRIWLMRDDGTGARPVTDPPRAGEWGGANLPFGDYDPRLSPDGEAIVFERLVDDASPHGNYDFFLVNPDGTGETRLTDTGYSQGLASWSHAGDRLVFVVAAIGEQGVYDLYAVNRDGSGYKNITPAWFPSGFLCQSAVFSPDDTKLYFIGEWWQP
jgi:Tol biopolymer transport system component